MNYSAHYTLNYLTYLQKSISTRRLHPSPLGCLYDRWNMTSRLKMWLSASLSTLRVGKNISVPPKVLTLTLTSVPPHSWFPSYSFLPMPPCLPLYSHTQHTCAKRLNGHKSVHTLHSCADLCRAESRAYSLLSFLICLEGHKAPKAWKSWLELQKEENKSQELVGGRFFFDVLPFNNRTCHYVYWQISASPADCNCFKSTALVAGTVDVRMLLAAKGTLPLTDRLGPNERFILTSYHPCLSHLGGQKYPCY